MRIYNRNIPKEKKKGDMIMFNFVDYFTSWLAQIGLGAVSNVVSAVITVIVGCLVINFAAKLLQKALERSKLEKAAHSLIISVAKVVLYLLLAINVADALGIDITGVVALASVLTLAVSLAMQNMVSNVVGGMTILSTHPIRSGDFVDIGGQSGTVQEITMTYTRLLTPDNKVVSIPNGTVAGAQITNYSAAGTRRVDFNVGASYDMDAQDVIDALIQAGTVDKVLTDPAPFAAVTEYGANVINYTLRVWVKCDDYWDVFFLVNQRIQKSFAENNVKMSYPHVNVHMDK